LFGVKVGEKVAALGGIRCPCAKAICNLHMRNELVHF
jgi:hypothetical protein